MLGVLVAGIVAILVFGTISVVNANPQPIENEEPITSCETCGGGCSASNNCGLSSCQARTGGTCGCGAR
ncbi:MAG: hypothetical protein ABH817_01285 [archaeon]